MGSIKMALKKVKPNRHDKSRSVLPLLFFGDSAFIDFVMLAQNVQVEYIRPPDLIFRTRESIQSMYQEQDREMMIVRSKLLFMNAIPIGNEGRFVVHPANLTASRIPAY